jgi:hypothetical protein
VFVRSRAATVAALVLVTFLTAACGAQQGGESGMPAAASSAPAKPPRTAVPATLAPRDPSRSLSPVPPPTLPPPTLRPPKTGPTLPTDRMPRDVLAGRVAKGGSGPCYAVVTDDNRRYALHSTAGLVLEEGTYIRAKVGPLTAKIDCGEGTPLALISFTRQ